MGYAMESNYQIIIGANSEIAKAIAGNLITHDAPNGETLILISRDLSFYETDRFANAIKIAVDDYSEPEIKQATELVSPSHLERVNKVFVCHGILHTALFSPEKQLASFNPEQFSQTLMANSLTPLLWLKHLVPFLSFKPCCQIVVFSARIGSISDNNLGGWYSYRASKAALNMMLKTAAIEFKRRAKNIKLIAFHPGTTDSPLSRPFQRNVPEGKLFTSTFVATSLLNHLETYQADGELTYIDWQNKPINY